MVHVGLFVIQGNSVLLRAHGFSATFVGVGDFGVLFVLDNGVWYPVSFFPGTAYTIGFVVCTRREVNIYFWGRP